jgi:hypothetical protein
MGLYYSFCVPFFLVLFVFLLSFICQWGRRVAGGELRHLAGSPGGGGDIRVLSYSNKSRYSMIKQQQRGGSVTDIRDVTGLIHGFAAGADAFCIYLKSFSFLLCTIKYTHTVLPNFNIVTCCMTEKIFHRLNLSASICMISHPCNFQSMETKTLTIHINGCIPKALSTRQIVLYLDVRDSIDCYLDDK